MIPVLISECIETYCPCRRRPLYPVQGTYLAFAHLDDLARRDRLAETGTYNILVLESFCRVYVWTGLNFPI